MARRLLLLIAALGAGVIALVLWSGAAYASGPRLLAAARVPDALDGARPTVGHPLPPLPAPPVPPVVRPVVRVLPPVVEHTLTRVPPVAAVLPSGHGTRAAAHATRPPAAATHANAPCAVTAHVADAAHSIPRATPSPGASSPARTHAHTAHHHRRAHPFPVGVADGLDNSGGAARIGSGSPLAVTTRAGCRTPDGWSHASDVVGREPEMVIRRHIARPG